MQQAVQHGGHRGHIAQQLSPVFDRTIRRQQRARPLVSPHDDFQQVLGRGMRQFAHAEIVDNEERHAGHRLHELLARTLNYRLRQIVQQDMRLPVHHAIVLLDGGLADGLAQVTLSRPTRASHMMPMFPSA